MTENELQERCKRLVENEVMHCLSMMVSELIKHDRYMDDLMEVCSKYEDDSEHPIEALEHWAVTDWLADRLEEQGEMILRDFLGFNIWGRTSGQAILLDGCIRNIVEGTGQRLKNKWGVRAMSTWIIRDWAGNVCFGGITFESFEDGEEWLSIQLGDEYETDRQEYEIEPL